MRIVLIGMKACGKTTIGALLAKKLQISFIDSDFEIEKMHKWNGGGAIPFSEIFKKYGEMYFRALEATTLKYISTEYSNINFVFSCGGRTPLQEENQEILLGLGKIIFLNVKKGVLLNRILTQGIPAFFPYQHDPEKSLDKLLEERIPVYEKLADITVDIDEETADELVHTIVRELRDYGKN